MLTAIAVQKAKSGNRQKKLSDGKGLYLLVHPNGSKYWRLKYRYARKEKVLALGVYPEVSLAEARDRRDEARKLLSRDIDPGEMKIQNKKALTESVKNGFEVVAREWFLKFSGNWVPSHAKTIIRRLERDVFPWLGDRPIREVSAPDLLGVLRRVESRGAIETAHRINQICGQVFRYAVATGRAERDPSSDLKGAIPPNKVRHHSAITEPKAVRDLLRAIQGYRGYFPTVCALRLAPLLFVRPGELRQAEWNEFDLDGREWRIPAEKMKLRRQHIVPLSTQTLTILNDLQPLTGHGNYLFPSVRSPKRPMSSNTINAALRRLGYDKDTMTSHGFRSMASTILNEQGWNRDVIERQLAHAERSTVRAAYNQAEYLSERRRMMQAWADFLDGLSGVGNVIPLRKPGS